MSQLTVPRPLARFLKDQPMHTTITTSTNGSGSAGGSRRRLLARRAASALTVLAAAVAVALSLAAVPALAEDCSNAALRAQNNSTQLPDCRAYELVSPVFKEGFAAAPIGFTDDGRLSYLSNGNYANNGNGNPAFPGGNAYLATRTAVGWSTTALAPSGPDFVQVSVGDPFFAGVAWPKAFSSDLRSTLWNMRRSDQPAGEVQDLYVRDPDGVFTRLGSAPDQPGPKTGGAPTVSASDDLSHVVFSAKSGETYEFVSTGGDQRRAVSVDNGGQSLVSGPGCVSTGSGGYHAMSVNGHVIFFVCGADPGIIGAVNDGVYARIGGTVTIAVSGSQCTRAPSDPGGACGAPASAGFQGANADGTRVYFTTSQQLVNGDTDSTTDLYECDIPAGTVAPVGSVNPCPDLREVSTGASGANVQGPTRISDDGSRAYFVATGVLASNLDANGEPAVAGDDKLYVWRRDAAHPDGETRFVAKLDPNDAGRSGMRQTTDDGRYLVFASSAPLIDHGPQADTDTASDIYRYDAETGALTRLSTDADGQGGNEPGADANFTPIGYSPAAPNRPAPRGAMTDDGGSVVFTTADALAPNDTNGTIDVYLWHDGRVSLISSGKPSEDNNFQRGSYASFGVSGPFAEAFISPSGRDVFFTTTAQLISSDVDTVMDTYDARVDGGFDLSTPPKCSGDGCQNPPSAPPPATKPGSTSPPRHDSPPPAVPTFSVKALTASQLRRVASTGKVSLTVTTNAPGTLSAKATATIAKRPSTVGSAKRTVTKPGSLSLSLTLSKKARAELKRKRKLTVKVLVGQNNVAIAQTVSLKLTQPKAAKRKAKKRSSRTTSRDAAATGGRS
jgi:hypothetical protein